MQDLNDKITGNRLTATEWNEVPSELQNIIEALGLTLTSTDLNQLGKAIAGYVAFGNFYDDSGAANAYVADVIGSRQGPSSYLNGMDVRFNAGNNNTGASTVNVAGLGVKSIKLLSGQDPIAGDISGRVELIFDSSNDWFTLLNPKVSDSILGNTFVHVGQFGAVGDAAGGGGTDDTTAIQAALDSFSTPLGGIVYLDTTKRYRVSNLTIPANVTLVAYPCGIPDQDEGSVYGYDSFWGGVLFVSGSITISGHGGAGIKGVPVLASHLNGYSIPSTDGEANTLVAAFTGTAFNLSGTGTIVDSCMVLGFTNFNSDNGNRHRIENCRFDCTNGPTSGGGSDVTRIFDCHGWPYLTTELGLSASVNHRNGYGYRLTGNADKFSYQNLYSFGHETGCHLVGTSGNVVQSCVTWGITCDSGNIGTSGTSVGLLVDEYVAELDNYEINIQNYDDGIVVDTQGADMGGGERLNKVKFHGGKILDFSGRAAHIINGYVGFSGVSFAKSGGSATACIDWDTSDGGHVTNCDFEEMFTSAGNNVIDFASAAVDGAVVRINNNQDSAIHVDNLFVDNFLKSLKVDNKINVQTAGELTISAGVITVTGSHHLVDTEADAATDDLDTISGGTDGDLLMIRAASSSRTVVCKDGTGNLSLNGDFSLDNAADILHLRYDNSISAWIEISRSDNAA